MAAAGVGRPLARTGVRDMPLLLTIVVFAIVALLFFFWITQRGLLYFPGSGPVAPAASVLRGAEDVGLETEDGLRLGAWFLPPAGNPSGVTILVFNGNAGDRSHRAGLARALADSGHAVLVFDYRGYGGNPGTPTERGLRADARAALAYLRSRADVDRARIVYLGESLGASVAAQLASEHRPLALVLRSPFPAVADVGRVHYPYLPVVDALLLDRYRLTNALSTTDVPVLTVAGARDTIVPVELSRRVHDAVRGTKRLVVLEGLDHNDPALAEGPALVGAVDRFLGDLTESTAAER